jgi:hypothetical protein
MAEAVSEPIRGMVCSNRARSSDREAAKISASILLKRQSSARSWSQSERTTPWQRGNGFVLFDPLRKSSAVPQALRHNEPELTD